SRRIHLNRVTTISFSAWRSLVLSSILDRTSGKGNANYFPGTRYGNQPSLHHGAGALPGRAPACRGALQRVPPFRNAGILPALFLCRGTISLIPGSSRNIVALSCSGQFTP